MRKGFSTCRIADFGQGPILISEGSKCLYAYEPLTGKEIWRNEYRNSHSGSATPIIGKDMIYYCTGHGQPELWAVRPGGHGVLTNENIAWKVKKYVPTRCSPILVDDLIFMVNDSGIASCLDARSGSEYWHTRIDSTYSASPIAADGKIYFFNEDGKTTVIAAAREFRKLAENQLDSGFMAAPAVSGDALILRTKKALYRVEKSK